VRQDEPMPFWDEMSFEIDLMVKNPVFEVDRWIAAGAMRLVVHMDSIDFDAFVELAKTVEAKGVELVIGFATNSSYEKLAQYIDAVEGVVHKDITCDDKHEKTCKVINWVQCMGIEHEGYQRQPFDKKVLEHIKKIKEMYPYMRISVDGGVNSETAKSLIDAGADRLVVGSALFEAESLNDSIVQFSNMFSK
jgi:ribulose-phosphate 3-epimerase